MKTVVVITGASSGIGLETARYLQEQGIRVYPTVRKEEDLQRLKAEGFDGVIYLDVTKPESIEACIRKVVEAEGKIDVWFNNAGYGQPGAVEDIETDVLREQFETNLFGLHEATRQVLKQMRKQGFGKIIQHSSVLGLVALPYRGAYNASKYAIEGLSDTLRLELEGSGIYVSLLNTGPIISRFRENAMRKLRENIDIEHSRHKAAYLAALQSDKSSVPFTETAQSVARVVHKIILSDSPKPRYYITKATYLLGFAKRLLSTSMLDRLLRKIG